MGAILRKDGFGGARSIFPSRPDFTFYEIALATAQYRNSHIQISPSLKGASCATI